MTGDVTRFVLLMPWGRVGSNLVAAVLTANKAVRIDNEPTTRIRTISERKGIPQDEQAQRQLAELDMFLRATDGPQWRGQKLSYRSLLVPRAYLSRLRAAGVRLVVMTRANHLKCAVSQLRARDRSGAANSPWESPWAVRRNEPKPGPAPLNSAEAVRLTRLFAGLEAETLRAVTAEYGGDWLKMEYADLAANPQVEIAKICGWIGLDMPPAKDLPHRKATSDDLSQDVTNYRDFAAAIRKAGFESFL